MEEFAEKEESIAGFFEAFKPYFKELRNQAVISLIIFVATGILGILFSQNLLTFVLHNFNFKNIDMVMTSPYQFINLSLSTGFLVGFVCTLPYALVRLYMFVRPALKEAEIKLIKSFAPLSILLFILGSAFGIWIMQFIINFYSNVSTQVNVNSLWDIQHFFTQILFTSVLTGLAFETPIVVTILIRLHIIKKSVLVSKRRYIYALLVVIAVLFPPTNDVFSLIVTTLPLLFLFELGLLLNRHQI
jgi:sec-independent protein translocase protein TatC